MGSNRLDWRELCESGATLFILQGFIASGKSTLARSISTQTGAIHLDADAYCLANFSAEELADWDRCFAQSVEDLWEQANGLLMNGQSAVFDFGFWTKDSRDYARDRANRLAVHLVHVFVTAPDDVLRKRIALRSGKLAQHNLAQFDRLKASFEPPTEDEVALIVASGA